MGVISSGINPRSTAPDRNHSLEIERDTDPRRAEARLRQDALEPMTDLAITELIGDMTAQNRVPEQLMTDPTTVDVVVGEDESASGQELEEPFLS